MANDNAISSIWRPGITLDELRGRIPRMLAEIGIEMKELGADHLSATMPVMRVLHGEASVVLAETLGTLAATRSIATAPITSWSRRSMRLTCNPCPRARP